MSNEQGRLRYAAIPLAVAMGLGLGACSKSETHKTSTAGALRSVRIIGDAKDGNINAVNGGERATVYDP